MEFGGRSSALERFLRHRVSVLRFEKLSHRPALFPAAAFRLRFMPSARDRAYTLCPKYLPAQPLA